MSSLRLPRRLKSHEGGSRRTKDLSRRFGKDWAVRDLALTVPTGSVFGLLGPNGAGKTTTIKMLIGLIRPSTGQAWVFGKESSRLGPKELASHRLRIGRPETARMDDRPRAD